MNGLHILLDDQRRATDQQDEHSRCKVVDDIVWSCTAVSGDHLR